LAPRRSSLLVRVCAEKYNRDVLLAPDLRRRLDSIHDARQPDVHQDRRGANRRRRGHRFLSRSNHGDDFIAQGFERVAEVASDDSFVLDDQQAWDGAVPGSRRIPECRFHVAA
jgi:hypothetical protein